MAGDPDDWTVLSVGWNRPSSTGRLAIRSYDLRYRAGDGGDWINGPQDVTTTRAKISGLEGSTSYQVQVRATDSQGSNSAWSASGTGTTSDPLPPPDPPTHLAISSTGLVTWRGLSGSSGGRYMYRIQSYKGEDGLALRPAQFVWGGSPCARPSYDPSLRSYESCSWQIPNFDASARYEVKVRTEGPGRGGVFELMSDWVTAGHTPGSGGSTTVAVDGTGDPPSADPLPTIYVYHDPHGTHSGRERLRQARELLKGLQAIYVETSDTAALDQLTGVTNSVLPRFFLGDPTDSGWTPQPKTNNGGLRWLAQWLAASG